MLNNIAIIISLSLSTSSIAANQHDSLQKIWFNKNNSDSIRAAAYMDFIWDKYMLDEPEKALKLADSLHLFGRSKDYPRATAYAYHLKGISCYYLGNYSKSLEYNREALAAYKKIKDQKGIAAILNNIGNIHEDQGNYREALKYYEDAKAIYEEIDFKTSLAITLGNIGLIYNNLKKYDTALACNEEALTIQEMIDDQYGISLTLTNLGTIYLQKGDYRQSLEYYSRAQRIFESLSDKNSMSENLANIGQLHLLLNNTETAIAFCSRSRELSQSIGALNSQKKACECLYSGFREMNKLAESLYFLEELKKLEDSLTVQNTSKLLDQMEFGNFLLKDSIAKAEEKRIIELAHKEEVQRKNTERNFLIGSTLLFVFLGIVIYSRWRYTSKAKKLIEIEKERSEELLLNILPYEIAEELKAKGSAEARNFDKATVIFTDFSGFTKLSSTLSATELVSEINYCFKGFDQIMDKYDIEKIKTIGDAYMAASGIPNPSRHSVENCLRAAIEMQQFISERKIENTQKNKPSFEMRVGIHTGALVAGIVGTKKFQYDIWGDTVNTASRMESSGEIGRVNISASTFQLIKDQPEFTFEPRGKIEAKGKGMLEMYFVSKR